jgi:hypothetical protein
MPNVFNRKDNLTTACLVSFYGKDNYIITLLQSIIIYIFMNSKMINNETILLYNNVIHSKNTILLYFLIPRSKILPLQSLLSAKNFDEKNEILWKITQ